MTGDMSAAMEVPSKGNVTAPAAEAPAEAPKELSDLEKIKAAQASRRSRRTRSGIPPNAEAASAPAPKGDDAAKDGGAPVPAKEHADAVAALKAEIATMRLEMGSLRRNHLQNLKKVTEERDMFATQLAREQNASQRAPSSGEARKVADIEVQLRAARTRNNDLEAENNALRDEVKQLNFRVQASKTIDAATNGYERIVDDLVVVKLKCAQLQEEKEDLLRINKELSQTAAVLTDANGELEKSRSQWVVQCADLEKKRVELEGKLKELGASGAPAANLKDNAANQDTSYAGSDLQELKL